MSEGRFPRAREIAPRRIAWFEDEVKAWQRALDETA
ncbi:AlpA family phage regulatory protein [Bradyrhizobium sp. 153]|nr:AlpA family phage regulatory protein [Bradyrhizobium sp. 153]MCK1755772.1 AlpA family phage regulatory protein [Bradyrhizobium sp. 137]